MITPIGCHFTIYVYDFLHLISYLHSFRFKPPSGLLWVRRRHLQASPQPPSSIENTSLQEAFGCLQAETFCALILRWLPVKALLRLRCVCKGWKQLIDPPFFIQQHLSLQKSRFLVQDESSQIFVSDPDIPSLDTLNFPIEAHELLFYGTHHGLVCLYDSDPSNILLWNPAIRKLTTVHLPKTMDSVWKYLDIDLSCFGFWIEPSTKEFKFVVLNLMDKEGDRLVGIRYSSIQQHWRVIPPEEVGNWKPAHQGPPVMVQGVAHWIGRNLERTVGFIMSYDFALERFDLIEMPNIKCNSLGPAHCRWQGTLSLVYWDRRKPYRFGMYARQRGLWVKMLCFNPVSPISGVFWVLGEEQRVKILGRAVFKLVLYDSRDGVTHLMDEFPNARLPYDTYFAYDFVESLLFP